MREPRQIVVMPHAVARARQRFRMSSSHDAVVAYIRIEVAAAIENGRVLNHKPKTWRLYREKPRQLDRGERFVFDAADRRAWIVKREPTHDLVVTSLSRGTA